MVNRGCVDQIFAQNNMLLLKSERPTDRLASAAFSQQLVEKKVWMVRVSAEAFLCTNTHYFPP